MRTMRKLRASGFAAGAALVLALSAAGIPRAATSRKGRLPGRNVARQSAPNEQVSFEHFAQSLNQKKPSDAAKKSAAALAAKNGSAVASGVSSAADAAVAASAAAIALNADSAAAKKGSSSEIDLHERIRALERANNVLNNQFEKEVENEHELEERLARERGRASSALTTLEEQAKVREEQLKKIQSLRRELGKKQKEASDPALSKWMYKRVESAGALIDSAETGRELGKVVANAYDDARHSMEYFEKTLESTVQQRFTSSRGFAVLLSMTIMLLPAITTGWAVSRISKIVTYPQYVFLIHIFNAVMLSVLLTESVLLGADPLIRVHLATPHYYLLGVFLGGMQVVIVLYMMLSTSLSSRRGSSEKKVFAFQACSYLAMFVHASQHVHPKIVSVTTLKGAVSKTNFTSYVVYLTVTLGLMYQVMSLARRRKSTDTPELAQLEGILSGSRRSDGASQHLSGVVGAEGKRSAGVRNSFDSTLDSSSKAL